jgi:hypothetical protein
MAFLRRPNEQSSGGGRLEKRGIGLFVVILIVGAIAGLIIGCYYFYLEMNVPQRFRLSAKANPDNTITLTISLAGGNFLYLDDLSVMASDSTDKLITAALIPSSGPLSVGSTCTATYAYGANPSGKAITVYVIYKPSKENLFHSSSVIVQG